MEILTVLAMGLPGGDGDEMWMWLAEYVHVDGRMRMCCVGFWTMTFGVEIKTTLNE